MKKTCVVGHFGDGKSLSNGQTIKTKIITAELTRQFGQAQIYTIDTHGGLKALPKVLLRLKSAFSQCENVIIMPAENGLKVLAPACAILNKKYKRKMHYVVVGGWLFEMLESKPRLCKALKNFDGIYVETKGMSEKLESLGLNIDVMPNFKELTNLEPSELVVNQERPYRLCTFSRVMKEKGIEEAVEAVKLANKKLGDVVYNLDIYGQVETNQCEWFDQLKESFGNEIVYKGVIPFDESVDTIKNYYALLFPTYYDGEGFAGTLLDAMAAGVPTIASDWKYNSEVVAENETGLLVKAGDTDMLTNTLINVSDGSLNLMKEHCLEHSKRYQPQEAIKPLLKRM